MWRNNSSGWGLIQIVLHWTMALTVFGLFGLGVWMRQLDYYSEWYYVAPDIHKSVGILLAMVLVLRLLWRLTNKTPKHLSSHSKFVRVSSTAAQVLLYCFMFVVVFTGYLIPTALGKGIPVFEWFTVPATISGIEYQADIAGDYHRWFAWTLVILALIHMAGALKHHIFDKDKTLKRMFLPTKR